MMRRRLRASSWAGAACWAERGARLAAGAGPNGEEGEERELGWREEQAENQGREGENRFPFLFSNKFSQKHFQIIFELI